MLEFKYKAFISYSHENSREASRLLRRLESYRIPRHFTHKYKPSLCRGRSLGKMFRDREDLPASCDMRASIDAAIRQSEFMIVVCSRAAAKSTAVNREIQQFVTSRDSANILCYVIEGEPSFEAPTINDDGGCIPPELRKLRLVTGLTPLAADARPSKDGKQIAIQKLAAGMLGVELDELLRRDLRRNNVKLMFAAAASFSVALITSVLLLRATIAEEEAQIARNEAEQQQTRAEMQMARAENLVAFMLEDLTYDKLQQLGRLDVIDAVVQKIIGHYAEQDDDTLSVEALGRKARAYVQLGRLYLDRDLREPAAQLFDYAFQTTSELYERHPDTPTVIFDHTASLYWIGLNHIYAGQYSEAEKAWRVRATMGERLWQMGGHSDPVWQELADMNIHLGWSLMELGRYSEAEEQFEVGLKRRQFNAAKRESNLSWLNSLAGGHYHLHWAQMYMRKYDVAYQNIVETTRLYRTVAFNDSTNKRALGNYARSLRWLADTEIALGNIEAAREYLKESLEHHEDLLDFEPKSATFRYNACVSTVILAEAEWLAGNAEEASDILGNYCGDHEITLPLNHLKIHNRMYGYRLALLKAEMALSDGDMVEARAAYETIGASWHNESLEVQNSVQGQRIAFNFALYSAALRSCDPTMAGDRHLLVKAVADWKRSPLSHLKSLSSLLERANFLMAQMSADVGLAR